MIFLLAYLFVWGVCLSLYPLRVSWIMNPNEGILIGTIALLFVLMLAGYFACAFFVRRFGSNIARALEWQPDNRRIVQFQAVLLLLALLDIVVAVALDGPPPGLGAFGLSTQFYLSYASGIVGPLAPLLNLLFLTAYYNERSSTRWALRSFAVFIFLLVALRGPLLMLLFQYAAMVMLRNRHRWRSWKIMRAMLLTMAAAAFILVEVMDLGALLRGTTVSGAYTYLRVSQMFRSVPFGVVLVLLYATQPASSLLWMMQANLGGVAGTAGLNQLIPRLFRGDQAIQFHTIPGVVDGVATYLAPMYLSLGWAGLFAEHLLLGAVCYVFSRKVAMDRMPMLGALLLCQISFSTFGDLFLALVNIFEYGLIVLFYRVCFQRGFTTERLARESGGGLPNPA